MKADSFWLKIITSLAVIFSLCVYCYTRFLTTAVCVPLEKTFYFLTSNSTHVEAGAHFSRLEGGAGYILKANGKQYAVVSVYLTEKSAFTVQAGLSSNEYSVLSMRLENLYFKGQKDKKNAKKIAGCFKTLYGYMEILNESITRLEEGGTQEDGKRILRELIEQMEFLSQECKSFFFACSKICREEIEILKRIESGTLYLKDLRYVLCEFTDKYLELGKEFFL